MRGIGLRPGEWAKLHQGRAKMITERLETRAIAGILSRRAGAWVWEAAGWAGVAEKLRRKDRGGGERTVTPKNAALTGLVTHVS